MLEVSARSEQPEHEALVSVARFWSGVFVIFGIGFAVTPREVENSITWLGMQLGLNGNINVPDGGMWWVLSLSLMVSVSLLAWATASEPEHPTSFSILIAAKLTSTLAFLCLIPAHGSVWILCALGDGFVAATLILARIWESDSSPSFALRRRYAGGSPFFEEWFGFFELTPESRIWLRYGIHDGTSKEATLEALVLSRNNAAKASSQAWPLNALAPGNVRIIPPGSEPMWTSIPKQVFSLGFNYLDGTTVRGKTDEVEWDFRIKAPGGGCSHGPRWLCNSGFLPSVYAAIELEAQATGIIRISEVEHEISGFPGMIGHLWGRMWPEQWSWVCCNRFEGDGAVVFEGTSAQVRTGPIRWPEVSSFVIYLDGRRIRVDSFTRGAQIKSRATGDSWEFSFGTRELAVRGISRMGKSVQTRARDPEGEARDCITSPWSSLTLEVDDLIHATKKTFVTSSNAILERGCRSESRP